MGYFKRKRQERDDIKLAEFAAWLTALESEMVKEVIEILNKDPEYKKFRLTPKLKRYIADKIIKKVVIERM